MLARYFYVPSGLSQLNNHGPVSLICSDDLLEERAFGHGAMGVMYTVCKEKVTYSNVFIAFRLLADWLQLWLLVVQPPQFSLPPDKLWWQFISFISLNQFMASRGLTVLWHETLCQPTTTMKGQAQWARCQRMKPTALCSCVDEYSQQHANCHGCCRGSAVGSEAC